MCRATLLYFWHIFIPERTQLWVVNPVGETAGQPTGGKESLNLKAPKFLLLLTDVNTKPS